MENKKRIISAIVASLAMLVIILDSKTALFSAQQGLQLCIKSVIPSLFPFFVLSGIISSSLIGQKSKIFSYLGKLCKVPNGAESLLAVGLLSGYPVGAQLVTQAYKDGNLSSDAARRMLGFCSNAGPAFIFGIIAPMFENPCISWTLWGIHIMGALAAGWILPGNVHGAIPLKTAVPSSISFQLRKSIQNIATVCGWVVLFRIILGFSNRWFLWIFPTDIQILFSGILELSNGCFLLQNASCEGARFLLAGFMISLGGLCVMMQTVSVTQGIGLGLYFPGKVVQTTLTVLCFYLLQPILFEKQQCAKFDLPCLLGGILTIFFLLIFVRKKVVAFGGRMLYNTGS